MTEDMHPICSLFIITLPCLFVSKFQFILFLRHFAAYAPAKPAYLKTCYMPNAIIYMQLGMDGWQ